MRSIDKIKKVIAKSLYTYSDLSYYLFESLLPRTSSRYRRAYWNAKAELTLIDKQHSLNEFTLVYIYAELLKWQLDEKKLNTLEILQTYMDKIKSDDYFDIEFESFAEHFIIVKSLS